MSECIEIQECHKLVGLKTCCLCKIQKPSTEFYKSKSFKDGLQPRCKVCQKVCNKNQRERNKSRVNICIPYDKKCCDCGLVKREFYFSRDSGNKDGLKSVCKLCKARESREIRLSNTLKNSDIKPTVKSKICPRCQKAVAADGFSICKSSSDGLQIYCKSCASYRHIESKYGVSQDWYDSTLISQNNSCAICQIKESGGVRGWHVDHNHSNNKTRGLLHRGCNLGLGFFKDNIEVLYSAIRYLQGPPTNIVYQGIWRKCKVPDVIKRALLDSQNGVCKICLVDLNTTVADLDHCHKSRRVRGYLCHSCNAGLGQFKDSVENILRAIKYLQKHQ